MGVELSECRASRGGAVAVRILGLLLVISCHVTAAVAGGADGILQGRAISVADGDTVTIQMRDGGNVTVRIANIDAPERGQPWGDKSKRSLIELVGGRQVSVTVSGRDRYGRTIGTIATNEGVNVGAEQVRRGLAWAYTKYLTDDSFRTLEQYARQQKSGLWSDPAPIEPERWRRGKESVQQRRDGGSQRMDPSLPAVTEREREDFLGNVRRYAEVQPMPPGLGRLGVANPSLLSKSGGRPVYTGPRGGQYYINGAGSKSYVDR